jgi:transcription antitermination factor NusG
LATHKPVAAEELFGELALSLGSDRWQVIHTKPQCEKKLADYLKRNSIYYYLPLLESVRHYKYRKVAFTKPMFPGYLFARFDRKEKPAVLVSGYVVNFLKVPDEAELMDDLIRIYTGRTRQADMQQGVWLEKGWQVEIISGPMQGVKGIVQSQSRLDEVNLQVNILRQAITVKVSSSDVRITGEYHPKLYRQETE